MKIRSIKIQLKLILFGILFSGLQACDFSMIEEVDTEQLDTDVHKLVVHSFISPQDEIIKVYVGSTYPTMGLRPLNNWETNFIDNATVTISNGEKEVQLSFTKPDKEPGDPVGETYYSISFQQFPIEAGKTYTLKVSSTNLEPVTATCTVPAQTPEAEVSLYNYSDEGYWPGAELLGLESRWEADKEQPNYYSLQINQKEIISFQDEFGNWDSNEYSYHIEKLLLTDEGNKGKPFKIRTKLYLVANPVDEGENEEDEYKMEVFVEGFLLNTDKLYYDYHSTMENYNEDNIFAEPVHVPTNIEGGLGIFSAYTMQKFSIDID